MRRSFALLLLPALLATTAARAQDVLDRIATDACSCLEEQNVNDMKGEALQMQLGLCMMKAASPYEKELRKQYKVDMSRLDAGAGERLGELVGMRLVAVCPSFLTMVQQMQESEAAPAAAEVAVAKVTGVVTSVRDRQFSTVLVKDVSGRTVELLRLEHFPNADRLAGAAATEVRGTFLFTVKELFDPVAGTYRPHNVLVGLELE